MPLLSEQCSPHNRQASDPITLPDLLPTARRLLGLDDEARPRQSSHAQFLADLESLAPPSGVRRLAAALDQDPGQPESPDGSSPPPDPTLLARVQTFITTQIDLWTERGNARWQHIDGPDRDEAPDRALVDLTPEGDRLHRYLTANTRFRRQAILELEHIQRSRASATREPVARSDSTPAYSPSPRPLLPSPLAGEGQGEGSPDVPPPPTNTPAQKEPKTPQPLTIEQVLSRPDLPQPVRDRIIAHISRSQEGSNGSITPKPD